MNTLKLKKIIVLATLAGLAGCSTTPPPASSDAAILSAEELQSMIQVTVTQTVATRN